MFSKRSLLKMLVRRVNLLDWSLKNHGWELLREWISISATLSLSINLLIRIQQKAKRINIEKTMSSSMNFLTIKEFSQSGHNTFWQTAPRQPIKSGNSGLTKAVQKRKPKWFYKVMSNPEKACRFRIIKTPKLWNSSRFVSDQRIVGSGQQNIKCFRWKRSWIQKTIFYGSTTPHSLFCGRRTSEAEMMSSTSSLIQQW